MPKSAKEWSPRGDPFQEVFEDILRSLRHAGASEATAIADVLEDAEGDMQGSFVLMDDIMDEFIGWARFVKGKIKEAGPRRKR